MDRVRCVSGVVACLGVALAAQSPDKQLVATVTASTLAGGIVSGLAWDGGTLVIQTAAMEKGALAANYFAVPGPGMELRRLATAPPAIGPYWKRKASRVSPTGLGTITARSDSTLPMVGISSQEKRFADAMDMGGAVVTHEMRLGDLVLNRRRDVEPFDGEVWSWSPPEVNRIAYVDEKGDVWIAQADGRRPERLVKGKFMLPAWSEDGRTIAVVERKDDGAKWEVSVIHLPEKYRR